MNEPKKDCLTCKYSGMDMDMEPYCAHPEVLKRMPYGQILSSLAAPTRPDRECTPDLKLWTSPESTEPPENGVHEDDVGEWQQGTKSEEG